MVHFLNCTIFFQLTIGVVARIRSMTHPNHMSPLAPSGQQTPDHEEGGHPDPQPQDVQQVQARKANGGPLRRHVKVHAPRQGLSVRRWAGPGRPHDPHGAPAPLQPLRTHAAHPHPHPPLLRTPPSLKPLPGVGGAPLRGQTPPSDPGTPSTGPGSWTWDTFITKIFY